MTAWAILKNAAHLGSELSAPSGDAGGRLAELNQLRDAGDAKYWNSAAIQAEELTLIDAARSPEAKATRAIDEMLSRVGDWSSLSASFDSLPEPVHAAVAAELLGDAPVWLEPVSWTDVQAFAEAPAGALLRREWGDTTAQKLAVARERAWRIAGRLSDDEAADLLDWLDACPVNEQVAVLKLLGNA